MRIAFNPSTVAALTSPPDNKDITFDLSGHNIFARGVKFYGTDTNTWRDIKINNVSIGSHTLDLRNGSNTTLTNTNGVVTINSTWRPVVDNLTSNSTTSSLSANQGRVLAGLINTLSTNVSNQYALRDGSNATGRWRGGLACFDVRDTNYTPHDLNTGLELLFVSNNTNNLKDGGVYNGVFSFRQWSSGSNWSGGKAHQLSFTDNENIWHRTSSGDDSWGTWKKLAYSIDIPTSLKNPYALTISLNGTSQGPYDGSAAKNINITPSSIGAATSDHNHDDRYLKLTGGTMLLGDGLKFHSNNNYFGTNADARIISLLDDNDKICDGGLIIDERATLDGKEYVTELLRIRDFEFKWRGADILHSGNYSGILDARYYTESEINSLLDAKLNRQNLSYGTWNPRGYHLAADYHYNGGDLSISENSGQIHVSIEGSFWQNEGRYRVLDTSDVASLKGDLTVHQNLSNTDTTWWPLIWGGSAHANTSDSTGAVYKSHDKLSWQTSTQTLYATRLQTTDIIFSNSGISMRGIQGTVGDNDYWRIKGGATASNSGYLEIATADDGNEPIYVSQYTGVFSSVKRTLTLLDANGFTHFPSYINIGGNENNNSSPDRVWGSNSSDSFLRSYRTSALRVANADTVDGEHASNFSYTHQASFDFSKGKSGRIVTFDQSGTDYGWINGFASTHNNYLTSVIFNTHRTSNWYVGYIEANISTGATRGLTAVKQLAFLDSKVADSDKLDGYHENFFLRYRGATNTDQEATLWNQIGIKQYNNALPDNLTGVYNYGSVISLPGYSSRFEIYASHLASSGNGLYYRSGWDSDKKSWLKFIDSSNIGSQTVASANKLTTARTIWGQSFDGTGNVDGPIRVHYKSGDWNNFNEGIRLYGNGKDNSWSNIHFGCDPATISGTHANQWFIGRNTSNQFGIFHGTNTTTGIIHITTNDNIGIGTNSPIEKLDVNGSAGIRGTLTIDSVLNFLWSGVIRVANKSIINIGSNGADFWESVSFSDTASFLKSINIRTGLTEGNAKEFSTSNHSVIIGEYLDSITFIFEPASDGQLLFMKLGKKFSNTKVRCTARDCVVVKGDNFNTLIGKNTTQDIYGDGVSRFFIYEMYHRRWIEFRCG